MTALEISFIYNNNELDLLNNWTLSDNKCSERKILNLPLFRKDAGRGAA